MKTYITHAHIISPGEEFESANIEISGTRIYRVSPSIKPAKDAVVYDAAGALVVPGFIDVHLHGACGFDVCDGTEEAIAQIAEAKLQEGCTSFMPTTLTVAHETLVKAATAVAAYRRNETGAKVLGLHLEGPFINPACCGAQNPKFVRKPDLKEVLALDRITPVKQVSFAPEMPGGAALAAALLKRGIVPSAGHSAATLAQLMPAYKKGLRHLTHFCNQMTKLHHREIGMVGAGFLLDDLNTEVIADRIHLCDDMLRLIFAKRSLAHIQVITDSLRCSHCKDGYAFKMGGIDVRLEKGEARIVNGGNLAGSTLRLNQALKNLRDVTGLPLKDLIRTLGWNQAVELGLGDQLGKVARGYVADLAVLDAKSFRVKAVFKNGKRAI